MEATRKSNTGETVEHMKAGAHETVERVAGTTDETVERVKAGAHEAVERVAAATTKAADTISEKTDRMIDVEERLREQVREYVRENPVTSLGIALGSGFILSRLMSHR
ncbi:MAG: DUF883 family protein [Methylosarcina sp.]